MRHLPLVLSLVATPFAAQAEAPVTTFTLDNGMDVVVIENHRAPSVEHMVWYRAGSADEPRGVSGIAHFLEHLMFKGTQTLMREQATAALYINHPYGNPIIGWRHEMEQLDMEDALAFYEAHYAPNNAILIVAGDADPDEVRALAEKHYGVIPANPNIQPRERVQEPPHLGERRLVLRDPRVSTPYVSRSYLAPERDSGAQEKAAALTILAEVLGGGQTSVLNQKLQFEQQKVVYTAAFYRGGSLDDTTFGLVAVPAPGVTLDEAEAAMDAAVADFIEEGVDPEQLERIKFQLKASQIYAQDDVSRLARRYGMALTAGLTIEDVQAWPELLQAVTGEDVIEAARSVFDMRKSVTSHLMTSEEVTQ